MAQKQIEGFPHIPIERKSLALPIEVDPLQAVRRAMAEDRLGTKNVAYIPGVGYVEGEQEPEPLPPAA